MDELILFLFKSPSCPALNNDQQTEKGFKCRSYSYHYRNNISLSYKMNKDVYILFRANVSLFIPIILNISFVSINHNKINAVLNNHYRVLVISLICFLQKKAYSHIVKMGYFLLPWGKID